MRYVEVVWADANGVANAGWTAINEIREQGTIEVISVGHLASETDQGLVVALSYNPESDTCDSFTFIPRQNIVSVTDLSRKRKPRGSLP